MEIPNIFNYFISEPIFEEPVNTSIWENVSNTISENPELCTAIFFGTVGVGAIFLGKTLYNRYIVNLISRVSDLNKEKTTLENTVNSLTEKKFGLSNSIKELETKEKKDFSEEIKGLKQERDKLREELETLFGKKNDLSQTHKVIEQLQEERDALKEELSNIKQQA